MALRIGKTISFSNTQNTIPSCYDCKHSKEDRFCELMRVSQSFGRKTKDCGSWGNLFEQKNPPPD